MTTTHRIAVIFAAAGLVAGVVAQETASIQKTSFAEVTQHLDPGGSMYFYMSLDSVGEGILNMLDTIEQTALAQQTDADEKQKAERGLALARKLVAESGIAELSGLGLSSVEKEPGLFHNKGVFHHYAGKGNGLLWRVFGGEAEAGELLQFLPETTGLVNYGRLDLGAVWNWWLDAAANSGIDELKQEMAEAVAKQKAMGVDLQALLASTYGEVGICLTLNPEEKIPFKTPEGVDLQIPELGAAVILRVRDASVFEYVDGMFKGNPQIQRSDSESLRTRTMPLPPLPFPIRLRPTLALFGEYLVLATNDALIQEMLAVRAGEKPGLASTDEFKRLSTGVPMDVVNFHYVSATLAKSIQDTVVEIASKQNDADPAQKIVMEKLMQGKDPFFSYGAFAYTEQGLVFTGNSSVSATKVVFTQAALAPTAIAAGMLLPALTQARSKARSVNCMGNLKQLGVAVFMCADENGGKLPEEREEMGKYLGDGKVWHCPAKKKGGALVDTDYLYFGTGLKLADIRAPSSTVLMCDKPGNHGKTINVLFADGHVEAVAFITIEEAAAARGWTIPGQ